MKIRDLFTGTRYVGRAEGDRRTYSVFEGDVGYLVVTPTRATASRSTSSMLKYRKW